MLWIVLTVLTIFGLAGSRPPAAAPTANRWAEPTRSLLAQHCGRCHLPNLPTSDPRALAIFDLTEEPWYGRLTDSQFDPLLFRLDAIDGLPEFDRSIVRSFIRCARDGDCPPAEPAEQ